MIHKMLGRRGPPWELAAGLRVSTWGSSAGVDKLLIAKTSAGNQTTSRRNVGDVIIEDLSLLNDQGRRLPHDCGCPVSWCQAKRQRGFSVNVVRSEGCPSCGETT